VLCCSFTPLLASKKVSCAFGFIFKAVFGFVASCAVLCVSSCTAILFEGCPTNGTMGFLNRFLPHLVFVWFDPRCSPHRAPGALMRQISARAPWGQQAEEAMFFCQICFENNSVSTAVTLGCGHRFCRECFTNYLHSKVCIIVHVVVIRAFAKLRCRVQVQDSYCPRDLCFSTTITSPEVLLRLARADCRRSSEHSLFS
jgi:hypothetical protein